MPKERKVVKEEIKEKVVERQNEITQKQIDAIWDVINEQAKNLDHVNDKLSTVLSRLGL